MGRGDVFDRHVVLVFLFQAAVIARRAGNGSKFKGHVDGLVPPLLAEHVLFFSAGETDVADSVVIAVVVPGTELLVFFEKLLVIREFI